VKEIQITDIKIFFEGFWINWSINKH